MNTIENGKSGSIASQLMAIEIISELLITTSPQKLSKVLTEHLRELTGAKTVMVITHRSEPHPDMLLYVSPARRSELFTPAELNLFCPEIELELPHDPDELPEIHPLRAILFRAGIQSVARFPLRVGGELIGILLLLDLPEIKRIAETIHIINLLTPPIALALKNALAYSQVEHLALELEKRVEERTGALLRKNAELKQSEERFRLAIQATNDGLWEWDIQSNKVFLSPRYCKIIGYEYDDPEFPHTFESWVDRIHPDDRERVMCALTDHINNCVKYDVVYRHWHKSGEYRWQKSIGQSSFDVNGKPVKMVGCISDITEKVQADAALKESEFFFRASQSAAQIGSYKTDFIAGKWESTEVLDALFGIDGNYERSIQSWLNIIHPDDRDLINSYLTKEATSNRITFSKEYRIIRQNDGETRWVKCRGAGEFDHKGNLILLMGTIQDITERKLVEAEKIHLESQLQQAQKMESIGRLAGGVAHDFNNMLGVILGHAELGLMHLDPAHPVCANLKEISKTAQRSADLTRQLLAFARKQTVAPKVLDLNVTVAEMLKMLQRLIGEDIHLTWQPAPELWQVRMDPSQIDQILANLCVNARDAIDGNGSITIETANSTIDATYCSANQEALPGEYVRLSVSDSGCGMDKETRAHVFEPFYTTKELGKGTGLGLSTVYGAVKQNNGFINIYSELGQGTTFSIYLPRDEKSRNGQTLSGNVAATVPYGQETILLVEDEPAILEITAIMLEKQGYTVFKAETPGEAVRLAREHSGEIQLLMTDVIMPEMNGRELAKNLLSLYPNMKRLFMSGYTADVIAHHGVLEEGVHFIQKPFSLPSMASKVREVLDDK